MPMATIRTMKTPCLVIRIVYYVRSRFWLNYIPEERPRHHTYKATHDCCFGAWTGHQPAAEIIGEISLLDMRLPHV
jgi:hypothetical protein